MSTPISVRGYGARNLHLTLGAIGNGGDDRPSWVGALCGERVYRPTRCDDIQRKMCHGCLDRMPPMVATVTIPAADLARYEAAVRVAEAALASTDPLDTAGELEAPLAAYRSVR